MWSFHGIKDSLSGDIISMVGFMFLSFYCINWLLADIKTAPAKPIDQLDLVGHTHKRNYLKATNCLQFPMLN